MREPWLPLDDSSLPCPAQVSRSEITWSMSRLPVFTKMLEAVCMAGRAGAEQAVVSDANTVGEAS